MPEPGSPPELIVIARREADLRMTRDGVASSEADAALIDDVLTDVGATMLPLFGTTEERIKEELELLAPSALAEVPDLSVFYHVEAPEERLEEIAASLVEADAIEAAYVTPPSEPPQLLNDMIAARRNRRSRPRISFHGRGTSGRPPLGSMRSTRGPSRVVSVPAFASSTSNGTGTSPTRIIARAREGSSGGRARATRTTEPR